MSSAKKPNDEQRLLKGYDEILKHVKDGLKSAAEQAKPAVDDLLKKAKSAAHDVVELTEEESDRLVKYVKRDVNAAAKVIEKEGRDLKNWLYCDWKILQEQLWETLSECADKAREQWIALNEELQNLQTYKSGEITSLGTLECISCHQQLHFKKTSHIPPCPKCHGTKFKRC